MEKEIVSIAVTVVVALFTYLVRSYFATIKTDLKELSGTISRLDGKLESLRETIKDNTIELAKNQSELKAIWRYIDAPKRNSDAHHSS